jgi:hypothetical protein
MQFVTAAVPGGNPAGEGEVADADQQQGAMASQGDGRLLVSTCSGSLRKSVP